MVDRSTPHGPSDGAPSLVDQILKNHPQSIVEIDAEQAANEALEALAQSVHDWPLVIAARHGEALPLASGESATGAEAFIILAATAGLFNEGPAERHPRTADPCQVSIHRFVKRDYIVRHAAVSDLERLCELEKLCWQHTRTPKRQIRARLQKYPQGQFVLEKNGEVLGVIYSQRIASTELLATRIAANVHELHDPSGPIVQLLAVNVDPRMQNVSYGDQLLELMLQRCGLMTGVTNVVGVTLCKSYRVEDGISFEDYIRRQGNGQDPVLAFHEAHGAEIVRVVPGYRPQDSVNLNNGVLVAYDILNRTPRRHTVTTTANTEVSRTDRPEIGPFIRTEAAGLLGIDEREIDVDRPLMEMGLDSADLLKLQRHCETAFGLELQAGFFFEYSNLAKVIEYLTTRLAPAPASVELHAAIGVMPAEPGTSEEMSAAATDMAATDIAVIGMSCKLPGGIDTPDQLWQVLASGQCVISSFPATRRDWPAAADHPGIDQGGFVTDADAFDAAFFRISPVEAQITDPQQRMLLELAWGCLEDAGIVPTALKGSKTGVFVGASNCDYSRLMQEAGVEVEAHHGVGSSLAILANRISYFFDLSGPSLVVDTACSASLVALHSAVQSLRSGECATAFVGGVNLICHPDLSIAYHKAGMLAPDARCKVFDASADGYVRSEGAVVFLLKPLHAAIADRNQIHAVIRGSATNHGGLASGLTVPNPQKQKELLLTAWKDAGIAAQDITYIEAHGTGTSLGDPIEIQGIQAAYAELASASPAANRATACAIGSVKSNLGHLESAAGITGLLKIIVSLQHRQLPASVNFVELNPKIRLQDTQFLIQDRLREWDAKGPRVAAVSSFGSGGTNAHAVVQEYRRTASSIARDQSLFILSAASEDRLRAHAGRVIDWLERQGSATNFADAIHTWQVGRTAMKHRLAIKVEDHLDLLEKLRQWLAGTTVADAWSGPLVQIDSDLHRVWRTKSGRRLIDQALVDSDLDAIGPLWASGLEVDWRKGHEGAGAGEQKPGIVSLPTYPFARERYWIDVAAGRPRVARGSALPASTTGVLHPLLHINASDLSQQSYSTTLSGQEFFLADHQVRADGVIVQKVLPGVAYLEMARAAIEHALPSRAESTVLELRNTVWVQPVVVDGQKQVHIALSPKDDDQIDYEIYSREMEQEIVHCQGRVVLSRLTAPVSLDLEQLEGQMGEPRLEPGLAYAAFSRMGLIYGPSFQGITAIHRGSGQLLAHLRLPSAVEETSNDFVLHPSVMDGAVQAAVGLAVEWMEGTSGHSTELRLPFGLESLRIFAPCTREMVAWVRYSPGSQPGDRVVKLDLDLCDERGNVCVQMHGFSLRAPGRENKTSTLLTPVWQVEGVEASSVVEFAPHHVFLCGLPGVSVENLAPALPDGDCMRLPATPEQDPAQRYSDCAIACFERIQAILQGKPEGRVLVHIVVGGGEEQTLLAGLAGLLKTAALENPLFIGQLLLVPSSTTTEELARQLREEKAGALETVVRHELGVRQVLRWQPAAVGQEKPPIAFQDAGVYLITGGLGGLGVLFGREIIEQTRHARVILTGRSVLSAEKQSVLDGLSARASYRQLDPGNLDEVTRLIAAIEQEHGQLNGILHCAGMIADNFIFRKDAAEFREVLVPKVTGTFNLDQASRHVQLDFFVLFSSIAAAMGNLGQADYATANAFMDQFAAYRNRQVSAGQRHGRTRSINWPLWQAGGMGNDPATRELLQRTTGMRPLQTPTGLQAFHRGLALPYDQVLVVDGDPAQIRRALLEGPALSSRPQPAQPMAAAVIEHGALVERTLAFLRKETASVLKMPPHAIDPNAAMEVYGIDSILAMRLTNRLEETFGSLPKTLFFEYRTIGELTEYFVARHSSQLNVLFAANQTSEGTTETAHAVPPAPIAAISSRRFSRPRGAAAGPTTESDPIAIIGLSGRYPQAVDVEAYWRNLREGKDCIVEVPRERWDWQAYFSDDRTKSGRHYSKWGGFIEGVDEFDPLFFNIPPREAKYIDPQERLFLQHAWMAVEDAGYTRATLQVPSDQDLPGQVGVYVGVMYSEYQLFGAEANAEELRMGFAGYVASIANRVSYALNLHGPSMTLDTMCSSSITAIHLACQDLKQGRTTMAIAGGVNVSIHPNKYLMLSVGQFISGDGHCQSFGEGGDGYIPGEGVGAVVLKRLSDATRDGDHIYGVIRGSALNHGGKTNGYTVPNPQAQASAIGRALAESRIDARHISYIEAHGTGTKLGDPIEIAALSRAFQRHTSDAGFCLIGSAKSNIGHCESAAGIAGLTKVLLQMQHRQIVPSLHSAQLNPHIDFPSSPFVVNQTLRAWEQPVIGGRSLPRIAGISSFGAGGSNAHMIIEEHQAPASQPHAVGSVAIVLSARTSEQLQQKAVDLLDFVRARASNLDLAAMAYTLQVGREAMDERLAFVVSTVEELVEKLQAYASGGQSIEETYQGQGKRNKEALSLFSTDADLQQTVDKWIASRKLPKLLDLWVKGLELDWSKLYGEAKPQRISLPTYPFARERYWIDVAPRAQAAVAGREVTAFLHPLLHSNTSDLSQQRYRSTFTGEEPFFGGRRELPSAVYLEMARAAVEHALPAPPESAVVELCDVIWGEPLLVEKPTHVEIALSQDDAGEIEFEIYSPGEDAEIVHCHGRALVSRQAAPAALELEQLTPSGESPTHVRREIVLLPSPQALPVPVERKKPVAISLAAPGALVAAAPIPAGRPITLSSPILAVPLPGSAAPAVSSVRLYEDGHGVFSIEIAGRAVIAHVVQALERVQQESALKVL
ncbi:MAG: Mycocerosate synthase, 6-deoxyerythronolide-B synthase, partial [Acidobacteria bacterium]|nr:Mycocerosate synthase, 6-deoxyerythronolide-B synthase [Acidobacteriota bacterium]